MIMANERTEYLTQTDLLQRAGWTKTILKKLDFQPDLVKHHYLYGKHGKIKLFSLKRIEEKENSAEFLEHKFNVIKRKKSAIRAVKTKKKNILKKIMSLPINVKYVKNVTKLALINYNNWNAQRADTYATLASSYQAFLNRISVNYIRHNLTKYEENISMLSGKIGKAEAYDLEILIVFKEIARVYPEFADECQRQYLEKHSQLQMLKQINN